MGKHFLKCLVCGREEVKTRGVKFFKLPQKEERRTKWLYAIQKPDLINKKISQDLRVCEKHFSQEMYSASETRLKTSATPDLNIIKISKCKKEGTVENYNIQATQSVNVSIECFESDEHQSEIVNVGGFVGVPLEAERLGVSEEHRSRQANYTEAEKIPSIEMASKSPKEKRAERKKRKEEIVEATNKIYKVVRNKTIAVKQVADTLSMSARTVYRFLKESNAKAYDTPPTNKNQSDIKKPKEDQLLEPDVFIKIENEVLHETDINAVPISQISDNRSFGENIATNINISRNSGNSPSSSKNDDSDLSVVQPSVFSSFPLKRFDEKSEKTEQQQLLDPDVFIKVENEILQETNIDAVPIPQTSSFVSFEENIATDSNILPNLRNFQPFSKNDDSMKYRSFEGNNTCDQRQTDETKLLSERLKDEAINCMKTYLNVATKRDVHSVFGEYTAQKLRNCCRSLREINVAKELIANVLDRLTVGLS